MNEELGLAPSGRPIQLKFGLRDFRTRDVTFNYTAESFERLLNKELSEGYVFSGITKLNDRDIALFRKE